MRSTHGGDIYRNRVTYDFSVNVNPYGMPESCRKAIIDSLDNASRYPDCVMTELREKLARKELNTTASADNVILGNGASELIIALCQYLKPKKTMVTAPSFKEYENAVQITNGEMVFEELEEHNAFDVTEKILSSITEEIDLLFLCNPNNPTGQTIPKELLLRVAEKCEKTGTWFCLDECFLPFMDDEADYTLRDHLDEFPHLVILKAFTKIFGMAGIRFGYLLSGNTKLLEKIREVMQPWNVSIPAQAAAFAALDEDAFVDQTKALIRKERGYLLDEMKSMGVHIIGEPKANFIFFKGAEDLAEKFLGKGVLIRSCSNYTGLSEGYFRIGVRTPEENRAFIQIFCEILAES